MARGLSICYRGYGSRKSGNYSAREFTRTMRRHHLYDCLEGFCRDTQDRQMCALTRKCKRRNLRKRSFSTRQWVRWSGARYGKCPVQKPRPT